MITCRRRMSGLYAFRCLCMHPSLAAATAGREVACRGSAAAELPSGVARHNPIPTSRRWVRRGRSQEARALRASAEIPASRASKGWSGHASAAATARLAHRSHGRRPQDESLRAACNGVPLRLQALMHAGRRHRRQCLQSIPLRRPRGCWPVQAMVPVARTGVSQQR
jgi:hypothetical protein